MKNRTGKYGCSVFVVSDQITVRIANISMGLTKQGALQRQGINTFCKDLETARAFALASLDALSDELAMTIEAAEHQPVQYMPVAVFGSTRFVGIHHGLEQCIDGSSQATEGKIGDRYIESLRDAYFFVSDAIAMVQEWMPRESNPVPVAGMTGVRINFSWNSTSDTATYSR